MRVYEHGAAANIFAPPLLLAFGFLTAAQRGVWFVSLLLIVAYQKSTTAAAKSKGKKLQPYLHICLPMYFASLTLGVAAERPLRAVALVLLLIVAKVGCCMFTPSETYASGYVRAAKCTLSYNAGSVATEVTNPPNSGKSQTADCDGEGQCGGCGKKPLSCAPRPRPSRRRPPSAGASRRLAGLH